jgi:hypothetical protein
MSRSHMPPLVHRLYVFGAIAIAVFVLIAWAVTAVSLSAKTISNLPDHDIHTAPEQCIACHQSGENAPPLPHVPLPSCGYCHR